jgi:hypothetical protein
LLKVALNTIIFLVTSLPFLSCSFQAFVPGGRVFFFSFLEVIDGHVLNDMDIILSFNDMIIMVYGV